MAIEGFPQNKGEAEEPIGFSTPEAEPQAPVVLTEAGANNGLGQQNEALKEGEKRQSPAEMSGIRKLLFAGAAIVGSLVASGCGSNTPDKPHAPDNAPKIEHRVTPKAEHKASDEAIEKDKAFLDSTFERISGGGIGTAENGDKIVHVGGGHYYELGEKEMGDLTVKAEKFRARLERAEHGKSMKAFVLKIREISDRAIEAGVVKEGHEISPDQLPDDLKKYEAARAQAQAEMQQDQAEQNHSKAKHHKASNSRSRIHNQKVTSPEAEEFLN